MKDFKVTVVIPSYNTDFLLRKNLPKVLSTSRLKANQIIEIIVVDDGSPDESVKILKKEFPEVRTIVHKKNRGFSAAVNTGVRMAKGNMVVLLNTDVIPEKDFLVSPLKRFSEERVFAVSLHEKGFGWARGKFDGGFITHSPGEEDDKAHETFWVSGGSGVFRRDIWINLGGMDETVFTPFYWEDLDLSYRAVKRGYQLLWDPQGRVTHRHETTMSKLPQSYVQKIRERNYLLLHWKNITSPRLFKKHIKGLVKRIIRHPGYIKVIFSTLPKVKATWRARKKETKEGKVSDEAIFAKF